MMEDLSDPEIPPKKRKTRPSRGRGLRTNTGCLTCRKRKLKCDESKPTCNQCLKSSRSCTYPNDPTSSSLLSDQHSTSNSSSSTHPIASTLSLFHHPIASNSSSSASHHVTPTLPAQHLKQQSRGSFVEASTSIHQAAGETDQYRHHRTFSNESQSFTNSTVPQEQSGRAGSDFGFSPVTQTSAHTPGTGSFDWYDLIARDAARNVDIYNFLTSSGSRWSFESTEALRSTRKQNSQPSYNSLPTLDDILQNDNRLQVTSRNTTALVQPANEPWSTARPVILEGEDLQYFRYFIEVIGPMLDLFDSSQHFTNYVPHLALYNTGLWKSMLAVAARHKGLRSMNSSALPDRATRSSREAGTHDMRDGDRGTQYYYDTLHYLSQAMKYPSYAKSSEIIATAVLISTYEAFGSDASEDWERHLKGVFWIQRSQDNDGEREGLRKSVWWNWLRQDTWAALRSKRKTLTIWRPKLALRDLSPEELASRALFLQAKAVGYASEEAIKSQDLAQRIEEGEMLLSLLREWYELLPLEFKPIPITRASQTSKPFPEIWIHPPMFAAAVQAHASAKILILLNKPSTGGLTAWQDVQKMLDQSVNVICGIAQGPRATEMASAMVNFQTLFVAGQCVRYKEQQEFIAKHLQQMIDSCKFPAKDLINELRLIWSRSE